MPRKANSIAYHSGQDEGGTTEWETPQGLFDLLNEQFAFSVDAAASAFNAKCSRFWDKEHDGLTQPWAGEVVYLNPPYGRGENGVGPWLDKTIWEISSPASKTAPAVVVLLPARTSERWWFEKVALWATEIQFIVGRLQFSGAPNVASFPSAIAIYRPKREPNKVAPPHRYLSLTTAQRGAQETKAHDINIETASFIETSMSVEGEIS